ncbi:MAG: exodeoxyribonuclease V subunit gamma [Mariprofundaceae bacterium]|nr:exodeoxyribonuclease V subunit gamma [Mariprofundaceae bacterium]
MSFHFTISNKIESLMKSMGEALQAEPLAKPLSPDIILVSGMPVQRWLALNLADSMGVHCNINYASPASWLSRFIANNSRQTDALSRESSAWLIFQHLPKLLDDGAFTSLHRYLKDDVEGVKRWQLSDRIADTLDRYQDYRPDTIRHWSAGGGDDWQAKLWRTLLDDVGQQNHRIAIMDQWSQDLTAHARVIQGLPKRISIFGISSLAPLQLNILKQLSQHTDIYFYYVSSTPAYGLDLMDAQQRLEAPNKNMYRKTGHDLLTSWGRQGQIFHDLLLNHDALQAIEHDAYHKDFPPTILGHLQRDIFQTQHTKRQGQAVDDSIAIHLCHSPLRECQVLHDELLQAFEKNPHLNPEDVLIMVPDINQYAPYIKMVFERGEYAQKSVRPYIPYNISDLSVTDDSPLVRTFLTLLNLPHSRFTRTEVEAMLDIPEVYQHFDLDEESIPSIRKLLNDLNVRWGMDAEHRANMGLPQNDMHTWKQAKQRFLTGYAMGGKAKLWQGIAPIELNHQEAIWMVNFWRMVACMDDWRKKLVHTRTAQQWHIDLHTMLLDFFPVDEHHDELNDIDEALEALANQAGEGMLSHALLVHWLQQQLVKSDIPNRYFSGGVNFCAMRPMRSVPFKMIALLGMSDAAFPRREHPLEFDNMAKQWQAADPIKGEQDRYLMLETLLCCEEKLYISYVGRNIRDNSACQPSILVSELCDELRNTYGKKAVKETVHPMQAFSANNFTKEHAHDAYWCVLANTLQQATSTSPSAWGQASLPALDVESLTLERLIQFVKHPVKCFINHRLNIYITDHEEHCDDEPFELNHLEAWMIKKRLLDDSLQDQTLDKARFKAEGLLPHGMAGDVELQSKLSDVQPILLQLKAYHGKENQSKWIDLVLNTDEGKPLHITGQVRHYIPTLGLLHATPSKLKGKYMLGCWLEHLALCSADILQEKECSLLQCSDKSMRFEWMEQDAAQAQLQSYVDAYVQGMQQPLPIFEGASYAHVFEVKKVGLTWEGSSYNSIPGDQDDVYVQLIMRDVEEKPIDTPAFKDWANRFYAPIKNFAEVEKV